MNDLTSIGVYTTMEVLEEKKEYAQKDSHEVWWELSGKNNFLSKSEGDNPDKIYFACDKEWKGYFTIDHVEVYWKLSKIYLDEWHELDEKPKRKPFQGYTYTIPDGEK